MEAAALASPTRGAACLLAALAFASAPSPAHAADPACESAATQKALTGNGRAAFIKQCEADAALIACDTQAVEKKLAESARGRFIEQCLADAALKRASPTCDAQAVEKKLVGSARTSFMKKCVAEASGGSRR